MKCPSCGAARTRVIETRKGTQRRRLCACGVRFSTEEVHVQDGRGYNEDVRARAEAAAMLVEAGWTVAQAAVRMKISDTTLYRALKRRRTRNEQGKSASS